MKFSGFFWFYRISSDSKKSNTLTHTDKNGYLQEILREKCFWAVKIIKYASKTSKIFKRAIFGPEWNL